MADEEFRRAITAYAQSGPEWVSKEAMNIWIEARSTPNTDGIPPMPKSATNSFRQMVRS
jgi:hypothetical protein